MYPRPVYQKPISLDLLDYGVKCTPEVIGYAVSGILSYMRKETFVPSQNETDGDHIKCMGLATSGSVIHMQGRQYDPLRWSYATVTVTNMKEADGGLVSILEGVAKDAVRKELAEKAKPFYLVD